MSLQYFLQAIEGEQQILNKLYCSIVNDVRHDMPVLLGYHKIAKRQFADWSMKYIAVSENDKDHLLQFTVSGNFNPPEMECETALLMMHHFRETALND